LHLACLIGKVIPWAAIPYSSSRFKTNWSLDRESSQGALVRTNPSELSTTELQALPVMSNTLLFYRLICMQYYPEGCLRDFLFTSALSDDVVRYLSIDILTALVHLRALHIAHNKLSSKCIFIKGSPKVYSRGKRLFRKLCYVLFDCS